MNENYFVSGGGYGALHAYDFKGQLVSKLVGHEGDLRGLAVSEDGKFLVTGSQDQTIRLWKMDQIGSNALVYPTLSLFAADNNDIIEVFKPPFKSNVICKKIILNKKYKFKVFPVSDLIQKGIESPNEYILNDSTMIKYNNYYSLKEFQFFCK